MGSDRLDRFIKGKVQNHQTVSDTDLLWQKIQAKQAAKKKDKRRFFFIWFFAGLLLISSGLGLFFYANGSTEKATTLVTPSSVNNDPVQSPTSLVEPVSESKAMENNPKEKELNLIEQNNKIKKEIKIKNIDLLKEEIIYSGSDTPTSFDQESLNLKESKDTVSTNKAFKNIIPDDQNLAPSNSNFTALAALPFRIIEIDYSNTSDQFEKENKTFPKLKNPKQYNLATELFFNYGLVNKSLKSNNQAYLNIRDSLETPMDVISAGLNFRIQHKSNFYLKTGLEYQQINERFENYTTWDSTVIEPNQIIEIIYNMDGTSTNTIGDGLVDESYYSSKKIYNRYRSIELPILIGYSSSEQRLNWFLEGGLALNLWFKPGGETLSESGHSILLKEDQSYFKSRTGLSLISAIGLSYQLNDRFNLSAAPNFKYQLSSVSSGINPVDQKYLTVGLRMGIGYYW